MNDDNWIFSHLDEFFDDVVDTLEDLEACNLGVDDWNTNFEGLEPPPFGWTDFPVVPTSNHISVSILIFCLSVVCFLNII